MGAPKLALQSLSAVGCKKLRSCWLGLQPASPADRETQQRLLSANQYSPPASFDTAWREVPVSLSGEPKPLVYRLGCTCFLHACFARSYAYRTARPGRYSPLLVKGILVGKSP